MDYTPPAYTPRRRPFRHRPRRSLIANNSTNTVPSLSTDGLIASLGFSNPLTATTRAYTTATTSTATSNFTSNTTTAEISNSNSTSRRRNLHASSFDPDCPFSFQPPKKRRIEDYSRPQAGNKLMNLSLAYCDGGTYESERYRVGNMLADDESVYCTERYSCNVVLQHETKQPFTLEYLEIKAPPHGFTSPISEGVIAVTDEDFSPVVKKIASYRRTVPLKRRSRRRDARDEDDDSAELTYLTIRDMYRRQRQRRQERQRGEEEEQEEEEADDYADGERLTEFDVVAGYRGEEEDDDKDEEDDESGGYEVQEHGMEELSINVGESDGEEAVEGESDGDDETVTPATTAGSMPWPPSGSRRLPRATDTEDDNDAESGNQHDCPYEATGEEEEEEEEVEEVEGDGEPTDGDSSEYELRRWLLRNGTQERRIRRRRREEEAEAEAEKDSVESDGATHGEAYMRFQLRDNKTFIVFNPPRYCKYVVLKLWGSKIDNVDIQSILGYGFYGKRVFPAIEMR
ncbi:hypothetical protein TWF481_005319 [Arthrobotrys musiformis]|uniref:Uncharacterized protein n=1 Tax=Arthrobotrys musiformis TaxID=47236 RepID=A0AAV9WFF2_9PEZI